MNSIHHLLPCLNLFFCINARDMWEPDSTMKMVSNQLDMIKLKLKQYVSEFFFFKRNNKMNMIKHFYEEDGNVKLVFNYLFNTQVPKNKITFTFKLNYMVCYILIRSKKTQFVSCRHLLAHSKLVILGTISETSTLMFNGENSYCF